jgi:S-adenosylmethionine decarboxylase
MNKSLRKSYKSKKIIFGKHLVIDAYGVNEKKLRDRQALVKLLLHLPKRLKMTIIGKPSVFKVSSTIPKYSDWGLSGFVVLLESHISFHTWPKENFVAMDVYSCKDFNHENTVKYLKNYWRPKKMRTKVIIRG